MFCPWTTGGKVEDKDKEKKEKDAAAKEQAVRDRERDRVSSFRAKFTHTVTARMVLLVDQRAVKSDPLLRELQTFRVHATSYADALQLHKDALRMCERRRRAILKVMRDASVDVGIFVAISEAGAEK